MSLNPPKLLIDDPLVYWHRTSVRSNLIYSSTVIVIIAIFVALPFLYVNISVTGTGSVQSAEEKIDLLAPITGKIVGNTSFKDNKRVAKETILLSIDTTLIAKQEKSNHQKYRYLQKLKWDVEQLQQQIKNPILQSELYQANWQQHLAQLVSLRQIVAQSLRNYVRYQVLFQKKVISQAEFEQYQFNYEQALTNEQLAIKNFRSQLALAAVQYQNEIDLVQNEQLGTKEQRKRYLIRAVTDGTLQNLVGLQIGSIIYANQKLGELYPTDKLLAFCYVHAKDISQIKKGQLVHFQFDAFNYREWGLITGSVIDISDVIFIINDKPFFKIKCALNQNYLQLKNGYKGVIKKGMGFIARFKITERSLFQLLNDHTSNWLKTNH